MPQVVFNYRDSISSHQMQIYHQHQYPTTFGTYFQSFQQLLAASTCINSHSVCVNALQAFNNVRSRYNLSNNWPSPVPHLSLFISYCLEAGYSPLTITKYLLGISFHHKLYNLEDPTAAFIVKKLLEGRRRMRPRHDKRAPFTESEYSQYYQIFVFRSMRVSFLGLHMRLHFLACFGSVKSFSVVNFKPVSAY